MRDTPVALDIERAVLASMLTSSQALYEGVEQLSTDHFYRSDHRKLYEALVEMAAENLEPSVGCDDFELLAAHKSDPRIVNDIIGAASSFTLAHYVPTLDEYRCRRALIDMTMRIGNRAYDTEVPIDVLRSETAEQVEKAISGVTTDTIEAAESIAGRVAEEADQEQPKGLLTGFPQLDSKTGGLQPAQLVILAGRPSMGKTALAFRIVAAACRLDNRVAIFSLETTKEGCLQRMVCAEGRVSMLHLRAKRFEREELQRWSIALGDVSRWPLHVYCRGGMEIRHIRAELHRLKKVDLIVVDYLQRMSGDGRKSRREQIGEICAGLKDIALAYKCPLLCLSQVGRAVDAREHRRPAMSDVKESGNIEEDADVVLMIYRESYYETAAWNQDETTDAEIIIGKQRDGPTGIAEVVRFESKYARFSSKGG